MLAVLPSTDPLRVIVATVSRPSNTRSTRSSGPGARASSSSAYRQFTRCAQTSSSSTRSRYGSGIRPAARRSVWALPGTSARIVWPAIAAGTGPEVDVRVHPSCSSLISMGTPLRLTIQPRHTDLAVRHAVEDVAHPVDLLDRGGEDHVRNGPEELSLRLWRQDGCAGARQHLGRVDRVQDHRACGVMDACLHVIPHTTVVGTRLGLHS